MSTTFVQTHVTVHGLPSAIREEADHLLESLSHRKRPYDHLSLSVNLRDDLQMPINVTVAAPVMLKIEGSVASGACVLHIAPEPETRFFPAFNGLFRIVPAESGTCELWLQGEYELPLGILGSAIDATFMRGAAQRSLHALLCWLSVEIGKNLDAAERSRVTQTWYMHGLP